MFTFEQLTENKSRDELIEELKSFLIDAGVDTTNWTPGSPSMMNLQLDAFLYEQLLNRISSTAKNQLNQFAEGSFLTLLSKSRFDNERILSSKTQGIMQVSAANYALPVSWNIGECRVKDTSTSLIYINVEPIFLNASNPSGPYRFEAEEAGSAYNIVANSPMQLVNTVAGVSVANPALAGSSTWFDSAGQDEESDDSLRARNAAKFATLQRGENIQAGVEYIVRTASGAEHVKVDDTNPRGAGTVNVYIADRLGSATPTQIDLAQDALNIHFFGNEDFLGIPGDYRAEAMLANTIEFNRAFDIYFSPNYHEQTITDLIYAALDEWIADHPIGGKSYTVGGVGAQFVANISELTDVIMDIEGVRRVVFSNPNEFTVGEYNKLVPPSAGWSSTVTINRLDK